MKEDPKKWINDWYKKEMFFKSYQYSLEPVPGEEFWEQSGEGILLPPIWSKSKPGRPRKQRIKARSEPKKGKCKLSRHGREIHCKTCDNVGHNKRSCGRGYGVSHSGSQQSVQVYAFEILDFSVLSVCYLNFIVFEINPFMFLGLTVLLLQSSSTTPLDRPTTEPASLRGRKRKMTERGDGVCSQPNVSM